MLVVFDKIGGKNGGPMFWLGSTMYPYRSPFYCYPSHSLSRELALPAARYVKSNARIPLFLYSTSVERISRIAISVWVNDPHNRAELTRRPFGQLHISMGHVTADKKSIFFFLQHTYLVSDCYCLFYLRPSPRILGIGKNYASDCIH